ncbi:HNH endonuclease family protein [Amycolatopsis sp. OK19-0408]|uniref:HNH endonuclease family protein n=1 Tax=Amycolatopsis iheyensis TaxID=2945988 RepID=A0A9X2N8G7_9PSEU|nr:HNH endonuclease family protein [Amycolatopsis iheyensis]MCR6482511.1 HNH endonuclease family protein [Amycolatopsis iheyensis]
MPRTLSVVLLAVLSGTALAGCKVPDGMASGSRPAGTAAAPAVAPAEARTQLAALKVAVRGTMDGYSREKFPHWDKVDGACDVREEVLKRDGKDVKTGSGCAAESGTWVSPYDGETWRKASDVDIDHMVPLGQAWVSGAKSWTQERREQFANDLVRPQLHAVTDNLNEQKSDKAPDQWKPPLVSYWCTYATDWIVVKANYGLTITVPEKNSLESMLQRC